MQKNTKTYLLLAIVLFIWGIIGYKLIYWTQEKEVVVPPISVVDFKPKQIKERDTFSIIAKYRDPFLGTAMHTETAPKKRKATPKVEEQPAIDIHYTGCITDSSTQQKIFFVTINGQQHIMKLKDKVSEVQLLSGSTTSIKVQYQNKRLTLPLQK